MEGTNEKKKVKADDEMKDKPNSCSEEDTEEMGEWRHMSQEEMDPCCKKLAEKMEEEVLDKYKVEDSKREAYRGRGSFWDWRRVRRSKKYRIRKLREDCLARIFASFREDNLQRRQSMHELSTEEEEMGRQQGMNRKEEWMQKIDGGSLSCWRQTVRKHGSIQEKKKPCKKDMFGRKMKKEDEKRSMEELRQQKVSQMIKSAEGSAGLFA